MSRPTQRDALRSRVLTVLSEYPATELNRGADLCSKISIWTPKRSRNVFLFIDGVGASIRSTHSYQDIREMIRIALSSRKVAL